MTDYLCRIGSDKYLHVIVSLLLTFVFGQIVHSWLSLPVSAVIGAAIAFDCGLVKEVYDKARGGKIDKYDIVADTIGCLLGVLVTTL